LTEATVAIRCGLIALQNFAVYREDGSVDEDCTIEMEETRLGTVITKAWMKNKNFPSTVMIELYREIDRFSEVQLPLSKPSEPQSGGDSKQMRESSESQG
jgi:hypothetical protein